MEHTSPQFIRHSMKRIIATTILFAVVVGVGLTYPFHLAGDFPSVNRSEAIIAGVSALLALVGGVGFLIYLAKSTKRFLYED